MRQHLLGSNKLAQYLLYAFSEIVLVVMGILIALYIGNLNNQKKNEEKLNTILLGVLADLEENIAACTNYISTYIPENYQAKSTLNKEYTAADYQSGKINAMGTNINILEFNTASYDSYIANLESLPASHMTISKKLKKLYVEILKRNEITNNRLSETVYDYINFNYEQAWSLDQSSTEINKEFINYLLNDDRYKAQILKFMNDRKNIVNGAISYKIAAIELYREIADLLNIKDDPPKTINTVQPNTAIEKEWIGKYRSVDKLLEMIPESFEVKLAGDQLQVAFGQKDSISTLKLYWNNEATYFVDFGPILDFSSKDTLKLHADALILSYLKEESE